MQLNELFKDNGYPYEWYHDQHGDNWEANFEAALGNGRIVPGHATFESYHSNLKLYIFEFSINREYGITNTGNAIKIFTTIVTITLDFLNKAKPNVLVFSAKEQSRKKLYARMADRLTSKGYDNVSAQATAYAKDEYVPSEYPGRLRRRLHLARNGTRAEQLFHFLTTDILHDDYEVYVLVKRGFLTP